MRKDRIAQIRDHSLAERDHEEITQARRQRENERQQHEHAEVIIDEDRIRTRKAMVDHATQRDGHGKGRYSGQHQRKERACNQDLIGCQKRQNSLQRLQRAAFAAIFCSQFVIHINFSIPVGHSCVCALVIAVRLMYRLANPFGSRCL